MRRFLFFLLASVTLFSCFAEQKRSSSSVFSAPSMIPQELIIRINNERDVFVPALEALLENETQNLFILVDKQHRLSADYVPEELIPLKQGRSYIPNRDGLSLTKTAEAALEQMGQSALRDGVKLVVSSSYRSWDYQDSLYDRNVRQLGKEVADRESAPPGASQHQLGTVVDFGSITDDFAETTAGKWLEKNSSRFGWSLSFPKGYESVTGYRWECWHYRFIGVDALAFQKEWFGDIQQYMLEFIHAWKEWKVKTRP